MDFSKYVRNSGAVNRIETIFDEGVFRMKEIRLKDIDKFVYDDRAGTEKALVVFNGHCSVHLDSSGENYGLEERDLCYCPPGEGIKFAKLKGEPLIVIAEGKTDLRIGAYVKKFKEANGEIRGEVGFRRVVYSMLGENDPAGRLILGYTEGYSGEWTSYPPHKHDNMIEVYLYYGLGDSYGIQVIQHQNDIETYAVRDWDAVLIRRGYHPNVSPPKCGINYLWVLYPLGKRELRPETDPNYLGSSRSC